MPEEKMVKLHLKEQFATDNTETPNRMRVGYIEGYKIVKQYYFTYDEPTLVPEPEAKRILEQNGHVVEVFNATKIGKPSGSGKRGRSKKENQGDDKKENPEKRVPNVDNDALDKAYDRAIKAKDWLKATNLVIRGIENSIKEEKSKEEPDKAEIEKLEAKLKKTREDIGKAKAVINEYEQLSGKKI